MLILIKIVRVVIKKQTVVWEYEHFWESTMATHHLGTASKFTDKVRDNKLIRTLFYCIIDYCRFQSGIILTFYLFSTYWGNKANWIKARSNVFMHVLYIVYQFKKCLIFKYHLIVLLFYNHRGPSSWKVYFLVNLIRLEEFFWRYCIMLSK